MLRREILLWDLITRQHHPHILPLIGITDSQFPYVKMVSPWQENGKLSDYVQQPGAAKINRLRLVSFLSYSVFRHLPFVKLAQACSAVQYLHNHVPIVIHGDLRCVSVRQTFADFTYLIPLCQSNVLVNRDGNPYLTDFGLATIRHNGATMTSALEGGSTRWMAPELFMNVETDTGDLEDEMSALKVTRYSDIWSFGMLVLELLSDELPFPDKSLDAAVIMALIKGERPKHPRSLKVIRNGLNNELWHYLGKCWDSSPEHRLPLHSLHGVLDQLATRWRPASPDAQDQTPQVIVSHQ
jgi:serine/threonine protein kinase